MFPESIVAELNPLPRIARCFVRPSILEDVPYITAIYRPFVETSTATFEISAPSESEMLKRWQVVHERGLLFLVAELEGFIVGYCYASQFRVREGYRFTVEDSIYVRPDCVGHGVGKALLTELISQCRIRGCHSMVACICGINVASVSLHASMGFKEAGLLPETGLKFGEWLSLLMMHGQLESDFRQ